VTENLLLRDGLQFTCKPIVDSVVEAHTLLSTSDGEIRVRCYYVKEDFNPVLTSSHEAWEFQFVFPRTYFSSFTQDDHFQEMLSSFPSFRKQELCCNTRMILHDLLSSNLRGSFRTMYFEAKAMELLLCYQRCSEPAAEDCSSCKFLNRPMEKDKIFKAKQVLQRSLHQPPTIAELALTIGINQCYLKKGFKEIFGTTIYDYVLEQRMQQAKLLLSTTNIPVSQIAERVGYASSSSFGQAFKKHMGVFPSELQS
jgi:AraC-like DNA-binding protein